MFELLKRFFKRTPPTTYTVSGRCQNCNNFPNLEIPRGMTVEEALEKGTFRCGYCGTTTAVRRFDGSGSPHFKRATWEPNEA